MGLKFNKKKAKQAKYLQNVLQLGNFLIKKKGDGEFSYIRISTVDGSWGMEFRDDTFKYAWIMMLSSDEKYHEALRAWIVVSYHMGMCMPDAEFLEEALKSLDGLQERSREMSEETEQKETIQETDVKQNI